MSCNENISEEQTFRSQEAYQLTTCSEAVSRQNRNSNPPVSLVGLSHHCCHIGLGRAIGLIILVIAVVRALDLRLNGRAVRSRPPHYRLVGNGMDYRLRAGIGLLSRYVKQPPRPTKSLWDRK